MDTHPLDRPRRTPPKGADTQVHPLDYPLMREAHRLRDLADKIDSLRRELAPRDKIAMTPADAATDREGTSSD